MKHDDILYDPEADRIILLQESEYDVGFFWQMDREDNNGYNVLHFNQPKEILTHLTKIAEL